MFQIEPSWNQTQVAQELQVHTLLRIDSQAYPSIGLQIDYQAYQNGHQPV